MVKVSPVSAMCTTIGATPAKCTYSHCSTPSAMPPATPASIALPPASRISNPACAARKLAEDTMWRVPMMRGWCSGMVWRSAMVPPLIAWRGMDGGGGDLAVGARRVLEADAHRLDVERPQHRPPGEVVGDDFGGLVEQFFAGGRVDGALGGVDEVVDRLVAVLAAVEVAADRARR